VDGELRDALDAAAAAAVSGLADGETVREAVLAFLFLFGSIWLEAVAGSRTAAGGDVLVHVWSTLPVGAGMGSSASYSVALAAALLHAAEARDAGAAAADTASKDGEAASVALRTAANKWAFECERLFHGAPSGIDNTVCSLGALCSLSQRAGVRACMQMGLEFTPHPGAVRVPGVGYRWGGTVHDGLRARTGRDPGRVAPANPGHEHEGAGTLDQADGGSRERPGHGPARQSCRRTTPRRDGCVRPQSKSHSATDGVLVC
jgi:hypothetical protein